MSKEYTLIPLHEASPHIDYVVELNEQQRAAVQADGGPCLVIAGAGSGKTRTLIYRVAWLLEQGIPPWGILLLTFTNKAAKEMLHRVQELVPKQAQGLWGGTFHSFANKILRRHAQALGYSSSFTILDPDDQKSLIGKIVKQHPDYISTKKESKSIEKEKRFPKPELILSLHSLSRNTGKALNSIIQEEYAYLTPFLTAIQEIIVFYEQQKKSCNSMDFDDLLTQVITLFQGHEDIRFHYESKFQHILVDEYQDTNYLQDKLVDLLVKKHGNIMVVGDDAQSIYSWRGADMNHILNFPQKYPQAKIYKIEKNYRSVPEILQLSNATIQQNTQQFEKSLCAIRESQQQRPILIGLRTPNQQAQFVAQRVKELIEEGLCPNSIAVLYRAHYQSLELQLELIKQKIPFQITSGIRFFEQAHIKDLTAFLKFIVNTQDRVAFQRIIQLIPGMGIVAESKVWNFLLTLSPSREKIILPKSFSEEWIQAPIPKKSLPLWQQFLLTLDELLPHPEIPTIESMITSLYLGIIEDHLQSRYDNVEQRHADIEQLASFSAQFNSLEDFLGQLSLLTQTDSKENTPTDTPQITLSSIHQAKGLEWHTVFLIGLSEGLFPHQRIISAHDHNALEEERRLFYVAVTRAQDALYLLYPQFNPQSYSGDYQQMPSRFLSEYPLELMERWQINA